MQQLKLIDFVSMRIILISNIYKQVEKEKIFQLEMTQDNHKNETL